MSNDHKSENPQHTPSTQRLRLPASAKPTKSLMDCPAWLEEMRRQREIKLADHPEGMGPFFRENAPYRAKISPPYENGTTVIIKGTVYSHEYKTAVPATMDVWQADYRGNYDNEEGYASAQYPFKNRARVRCDEHGYYEIETIQPGPYTRGTTVHAAHIHFRVSFTGHVPCVTQLLFEGDTNIPKDPFRDYSAVIKLTEVEHNGQKYKEGIFDIVLKLSPDGTN
jgi:protocatechuate 3,4-dioxygenase beta subunit